MEPAFHAALSRGLAALALPVAPEALPRLERFADRLLAWNRKVNLTTITDPAEVAEKHLVDSLLLLPLLDEVRTLLDLGSGAGLPGVPLACARPALEVTCCDSVAKKVAFVKAVAAELDLPVRAFAVRAEGDPEGEKLPRADAVVSRALSDPERWVPLGVRYLAPGGTLFAMLGREADEARLAAIGAASGLALVDVSRFELPLSRSARAIARWRAR
ncbi:16S rRNA (guanine(527)-N(7))-methyltransferase RsmG [Anaeromyxobacter sp. Fw109-5]|uniref:Ribosomal RNA small subunit methyltransferase G n=1 Tax=Anaeromyxobacter sp. (strain Fw109-5) TaxID=404589 RepID=RSMG_ANADF|nr:16S rRNA (guanine(527)-N(7))-methyltransferase RsmG [Anaeromyxobacter sp. Fw109-5]A7HIY6.1 RecName: Full=Ribosomal RNA small subunit methyltransferase G; AltName: Full=16S rRNA 7-methylguanosine methyltransferase; Short=16S rRNA m7G methyltransferase [Anaeromyxobacter sp. Fw109-5]ABS28682.1 methyltransferase GidB [Anaeromyxobacter sp. Fw109-5]